MKIKGILIITALVLIVAFVIGLIAFNVKRSSDYNFRLVSAMNDEEMVTLKNVFSFDFHKAYVIDDPYISGTEFAAKYGLNISIDQVKAGADENVQRIVFVDSLGSFVYEFKCNKSEIIIAENGIVIYPETVIERTSQKGVTPLEITFKSMEKY
jgi:hypothetical protein